MAAPALASTPLPPTRRRIVQVTGLAWLAGIGFDLAMNAGLLARLNHWELPGFLPPLKMFQYIPLGYAAFLLWTILAAWLMVRLGVTGLRGGAMFGVKFGLLFAGAGFLGQMSIFAYPVSMFFGWFIFQLLFFVVVGTVTGAGLAAPRLRRITWAVVAFVVLCVIVAVAMQNLGLAPTATHGSVRGG